MTKEQYLEKVTKQIKRKKQVIPTYVKVDYERKNNENHVEFHCDQLAETSVISILVIITKISEAWGITREEFIERLQKELNSNNKMLKALEKQQISQFKDIFG